MSQKVNALTAIPAVPDRTRDPQTTFNAKTVAWMEAQKRNTDDFNFNVPTLNQLFTKADQAFAAADESRENADMATQKAGEAATSAQSALEFKEAAQTARTGAEAARTGAEAARDAAEAARDAAEAAAGVDIATTEKAGLVKPDGATLKMMDAAGKMVVEDIAIGGNASDLASARGRFGKLASGVGITSLRRIGVTCDLHFSAAEWGKVTDRPFNSAAGAVVSIRSNEDVSSNRGHILAKSLATGEMWIAYRNATTTSAFRKVITTTDVATRSTLGVVKVGGGLDVSGDGTLRYAGMSAATLDVGGNTRLNASSARNFVLTATGASSNVLLPDPSSLYAGEQFTFFAEGDNILVRDFKGQTVGPALTRGKAYLFTLINGTTGEWARAEFSASGISGENGGSLGLQPLISAPVIFSDVAEFYSTDIELETGRVLHFGSSVSSDITGGMLSLVSVTGWSAVSVENTSLTLPQDFILSDFRKMSSSLCCVLAKDTTNKKFAVIPVDVSGATAVVGTANILTTTGTLVNPIFSRVDDNHALLVYGDDSSLYARVYSFSGSTVTAATPVLVREASSGGINTLNVQRMDDTRWLLWTGGFVLQVLGVSGTAVTVGEPVTFTPDASWTSSKFLGVSPTPGGDVLIYFSYTYKTGVITTKTAYALLVYTSSGLVLTKGNMTELSGEYISPMFFNIDGHMFLLGKKSGDYYLVPVTVDNGTATVGADFLFIYFDSNSTLLTYIEGAYAIRRMLKNSNDRIIFQQKNFTIAPDGSLTESDTPGYATSISNLTWGRNPCIQAFPGGPYVSSVGFTWKQNNSDGSTTTGGATTVSVMDSSFTKLCDEARVDGFIAKPYDGSSNPISSPYLYPSLFQTGEYQVLVILNHYDTRKPAWALFTL